MTKVKCSNCANQIETDLPEYRCAICGAANVVPTWADTADDACTCLAPTGYEWTLPAGKLPGGIYVTAQGTHMTREKFIKAYNTDPELALEWMRAQGKNGADGAVNVSQLGKRK